jgi:hypothetical protein
MPADSRLVPEPRARDPETGEPFGDCTQFVAIYAALLPQVSEPGIHPNNRRGATASG